MDAESADKPAGKARRRWLRFSLRGLMLLIVVIAVPLAWTMNKARQQRIAVAALREMGCTVEYDGGSPFVPEWLSNLMGDDDLANVWTVDARDSQVTDAGLVHLRRLTQLQVIVLGRTQITDAGLAHLRGLSQLHVLRLDETQITDAGLVHLRGFVQLHGLTFQRTQIADTGLAHLQGLTQLTDVFLAETQVTDAGLVHLRGLNQLQNLDLRGTRVTDAGCQELQRALPKLQILR